MAKGIGCHMLTIEDLLRNAIGVRDKKSLTCSLLNVFFGRHVVLFCVERQSGARGEGRG